MSRLCIERRMILRMSTVSQRPAIRRTRPSLSANIYISSQGMPDNCCVEDLSSELGSGINRYAACEDVACNDADDNNNDHPYQAQCERLALQNDQVGIRSLVKTIGPIKSYRKDKKRLKSKVHDRNDKSAGQEHQHKGDKINSMVIKNSNKMQRTSCEHFNISSKSEQTNSSSMACKFNLSLLNDTCSQAPKSRHSSSKRIKRLNKVEKSLFESHHIEELVCSCKQNASQVFDSEQELDAEVTLKATARHISPDFSPSFSPKSRASPHKLVSLGERNGGSICNKHMPWFGIDVGGSLIKVVFFDPKEATREEMITLKRIRRYLKSSKPYGETGKRDTHLEMPNCVINKRQGSLHFIRFATSQMPEFLLMAKNKRFADTINTVCATGGGAYKFEEDIKTNLGITIHKSDELDSIIYGIHYIDKYNFERECYYLDDPLNDEKCVKVPYDFSRPYPYLVVNIGSGVSILAVYSSTSYSRISGSSIGGGTFLGLCCLLTQCKTFDEAIRLAKAGSSTKIDKLVKDIYGGDYPKFNLSGDTVASSFGHMNMVEKREGVKREDLARALLEMVTINIGSIARMCAANENIDRVVFIGNFLRVNQLSMKLLSYAVNYWSKGAMKALFLEHEGYFGAVGCFVESTQGCHH